MGREGRAWDGRGGEGRRRSTCLPPRFDNPGYGPDGGNGKMVMEMKCCHGNGWEWK